MFVTTVLFPVVIREGKKEETRQPDRREIRNIRITMIRPLLVLALLAAVCGETETSRNTLRGGNAGFSSTESLSRRLQTGTGQILTNYAGSASTSGSTDGAGTAATFYGPNGLSIDTSGNLYVADVLNHKIRKIDGVTGVVSTIAGLGYTGSSGDDKSATMALLKSPNAVSVDASNVLYIADTGNCKVGVDRVRSVCMCCPLE